jgi:hypothetical protein
MVHSWLPAMTAKGCTYHRNIKHGVSPCHSQTRTLLTHNATQSFLRACLQRPSTETSDIKNKKSHSALYVKISNLTIHKLILHLSDYKMSWLCSRTHTLEFVFLQILAVRKGMNASLKDECNVLAVQNMQFTSKTYHEIPPCALSAFNLHAPFEELNIAFHITCCKTAL